MEIHWQRKHLNGYFINLYETSRIIFGFTEIDCTPEALAILLHPYPLQELKQIHSDLLHMSSQVEADTEGDGIILDRRGTAAVIKTADCTPLFFWDNDCSIGGVVHIGWKGLQKGIEKKLLHMLKEKNPTLDIPSLNIYLGPSIEKNCYEVGTDLYEAFSLKKYRQDVFYPLHHTNGKFLMDVKKGIRLSLLEEGITGHRIGESGLCTYCEAERLPSHRRCPEADGRIYNFLVLKEPN